MKIFFWSLLFGSFLLVTACQQNEPIPPSNNLETVLGQYHAVTKVGSTEYIILLILTANTNNNNVIDVIIQHKESEYVVAGQLFNNGSSLRIAPQTTKGERFEGTFSLTNKMLSGTLYHNGQAQRIHLGHS